MGQRTIYTCDRCHVDYLDSENNRPPFPEHWSVGQKSGVINFILCPTCTEALRKFLDLQAPPTVADIAASIDDLIAEQFDDDNGPPTR